MAGRFTKPSHLIRSGIMLGLAGVVAVVAIGGLAWARVWNPAIPTFIAMAAGVALVGAVLLAVGGVAYARRFRKLERQREALKQEQEGLRQDDSVAADSETGEPADTPDQTTAKKKAQQAGAAPSDPADPKAAGMARREAAHA